ncbi:alpha/beta fold hydrolase [Pseudomonas sp. P9_35]|uniref:UilS family quorum-quenching N-acyl-homoserine lactonase n=1 Tax=unclassified Pseudomonas TaxID=196821 RepID=UPI002A369C0B|nr:MULTISPECIES: alpha/beta fold hydrolase [unclassified Pseudomonas]WPN65651.1 alpha/beta fold hydrolase [Pseudomonas sp. P9_32]WPN71402.1 alpha/beta fold hydrolase [Pseudomonas sp. P9_35]
MTRCQHIEIPHLPLALAGRVYRTSSLYPAPVIILCHGFCGIQQILLPAFAQAFADAGFCAVTFDYRSFGASEGEPGRLVPAAQVEDVLAVIEWVKRQPQFDAERIGLWGTSLGGCHAISAAAGNGDVKCVVSQLPFADGESLITGEMGEEEKQKFLSSLETMQQKKETSGRELFVPIPKVMSDSDSRAFFNKYKDDFPQLNVKIPYLTVREMLNYKPINAAARVTQPTLIVAAELDEVNPPSQAEDLYEALAGDKAFYLVNQARHYDVYEGDMFSAVIGRQIEWFRQFL